MYFSCQIRQSVSRVRLAACGEARSARHSAQCRLPALALRWRERETGFHGIRAWFASIAHCTLDLCWTTLREERVMTEFPESRLDEDRKRLMKSKFGTLLDWRIPDVKPAVGPHNPKVFERYDDARRKIIDQCCSRLLEYSDDEVRMLLGSRPASDAEEKLRRAWTQFCRSEVHRLRQFEPPWYAGGFGHPDHIADFSYWATMPRFTVEEMLCLSIGFEPFELKPSNMLSARLSNPEDLSDPLVFLQRRHEQLRRRFDGQGHGWTIDPSDFLDWVDQTGFGVHPGLLDALMLTQPKARNAQASPVAGSTDAKADPRETDKMAQLITAMAIDCYRYDPRAKRSPVPSEILNIVHSFGMNMSRDTVLKYLRRGAEFISPDWRPPGT